MSPDFNTNAEVLTSVLYNRIYPVNIMQWQLQSPVYHGKIHTRDIRDGKVRAIRSWNMTSRWVLQLYNVFFFCGFWSLTTFFLDLASLKDL